MDVVENFPLGVVVSGCPFVVLDLDLALVSEHSSASAASKALADFVLQTNNDGAIYRRTAIGWVRY
jgi:hypothetical protein